MVHHTSSVNQTDKEGDTIFYKELMEQFPIKANMIAKESRTDSILSHVIYFVQNSWPEYNVPQTFHTFH